MTGSWRIGDRIENRWQIYRILRGGMGIVYVVYDHEWHEPLAVKTFQDEVFARNPTVAELFTREALAWTKLDFHPNVTAACFVHKIEGKPFLFLEYVSGGDLGDWVGTPRLTEDLPQVLRFAIQFCDGMTYALSKGVIAHRDIKPQNCLVRDGHTLSVTDFGLAKVFASEGRSGGGGTPAYISPEQWDDFDAADVRADIYSFGVMLFQMATGRLPFEARSRSGFAELHKKAQPPSLGRHAELDEIVQRCMEKVPGRRYSEFGDLRDRLAGIYKKLTGEEPPRPAQGSELNVARMVNKGGQSDTSRQGPRGAHLL